MKKTRATRVAAVTLYVVVVGLASSLAWSPQGREGQPAPAAQGVGTGRGAAPPPYVSPEVLPDKRVTLRIFAPRAEEVRLIGTDIPRNTGLAMTRAETGVWEVIVGPLEPGSYRYHFNVNGVSVIDPRSPAVSESNNNVWSVVNVPGSALMDTKAVPHGAVAAVTYHSSALQKARRMHVYTPPGYELGAGRFPVFYLLHGAGDSDDSWTSVGRAGFILDNLIAAKKAKPMIVVMPAGHTSQTTAFATPVGEGGRTPTEEFVDDFVRDVVPYVEKNYRVLTDRPNRAIAGLSMGGSQTLEVAIPRLDQFTYVGVFSSGLLGSGGRGRGAAPAPGAPPPPPPMPDPAWEQRHLSALDNAATKKGLKLFWFATGSEDRLLPTTKATVDLFKRHGFTPLFKESAGGHTWLNWRDYLTEFAPQLFQ